jgi:hypothetical protein
MPADRIIGSLKESSLHASLKRSYAGSGGTERNVAGFVCDALAEDGAVVEIQTGSFAPLIRKVAAYSSFAKVRIVHPIALERRIETRDETGEVLRSRRSPRRGSAWDLFTALVYAPRLPLEPGLTIELAFTEETEVRVADGKGSWRRKGVSVWDRVLIAVKHTEVLSGPADFGRFLPPGLPEDFSAADLAAAAGIKPALARRVLYVLVRLGLIAVAGKKSRSRLYRRSATAGAAMP